MPHEPTPARRSAPPRPSAPPTDTAAMISATPPGTVTLGRLLARAGEAVRVGLPEPMWVLAAVAAAKPARGGHTLELVEAEASGASGQLRAYLPDSAVEALRRVTGHAIIAGHLAGLTAVLQLRCNFDARWGLSARVTALAPGLETSLVARAVEAARARLRAEGLLDRQRQLPLPRDVTRVTVVHPHDAAGWADVAGELRRWAAAGVLTFRSMPVPFEGADAAAGLASAVGRATSSFDGVLPDLLLVVRGGGARAGLAPLDDEGLARAIATAPVPIITGIGHASDSTLADDVSLRTDTPSKALAFVRELIVQPARRARIDYAAILAAASGGVDRAAPRLAATERLVTAEALRHAGVASERLHRNWGAVREAAQQARGQLARLDDALDHIVADVAGVLPLHLGRTTSELAALMEAIRARARRDGDRADDGARHLDVVADRAVSLLDTAATTLLTLGGAAKAAAVAKVARASSELEALTQTVRERSQRHVTSTDDGSRAVATIEAAVAETCRAQLVEILRLLEAIETAVDRRLAAAEAALDRALATLDGADPANILRRGFVLVMDGQGHLITSVAAATAAVDLVLSLADGMIAVRLTT
ncbi:hypothetical protein D3273_14210 [Lichenibacterium minor]|uniref:Exonuclease VII large subunit C-terminal domain-containing protein n=2 Tax=Lichenibacterium minor TaxID=2316528 RepID=A0A4Q2U606_9HYPH|nr:hypothetical protein D3273_14210 [Lichenibacterium minor]